jgi:hypothetical protein
MFPLQLFDARVVVGIILLAALAAAPAAGQPLELAPGDVLTDVEAQDGATTCLPEEAFCEVELLGTANTLRLVVSAGPTEDNAARASIFTDFTVRREDDGGIGPVENGDGSNLLGSLVTLEVSGRGMFVAGDADHLVSYRVDVQVTDTTAGDLPVGTAKLDSGLSRGSPLSIEVDETVALPVPLVTGRVYRISLILSLEASSAGGFSEDPAVVDFFADGFLGWTDLNVIAGTDPFAAIAAVAGEVSELDSRVTQTEQKNAEQDERLDNLEDRADVIDERVDNLEDRADAIDERVDELEEDLRTHTHTYRTGRGVGHNNTDATTTTPSFSDGDGPGDGGDHGPGDGGDDGAGDGGDDGPGDGDRSVEAPDPNPARVVSLRKQGSAREGRQTRFRARAFGDDVEYRWSYREAGDAWNESSWGGSERFSFVPVDDGAHEVRVEVRNGGRSEAQDSETLPFQVR